MSFLQGPDPDISVWWTLVGGAKAGESLAKPVRGTLYLAGEATVDESDSGTVHGAIRSGHRAAKQVAQHLGAR